MATPAWVYEINPVWLALLATLFTWGVTALGAAMVFFFKTVDRKLLDGMLGFAAGVMIAASFWSLLAPAIAMAQENGNTGWFQAATGLLLGGFFVGAIDKVLPHLHLGLPKSQAEGIKTEWQRSILLVMAITLHNLPEGLAVGVAFGAIGAEQSATTVGAAVALAIGIGLQNFPEGMAVSVPLRREGIDRSEAFLYGQASGMVEPIGGIVGALAVQLVAPILPYALAFAAGAMLFVVIEELIPESQQGRNTDLATAFTLIGFVVMMVMDVALS
jgi:ZIP family zinc transporter